MLVPFLVFAIGISHGVQMVNAVAIEAGKGYAMLLAGKRAFSNLVTPGATALLSDAVGFLTLIFIEIASIGVASIVFTNLLLLPMLITKLGICETGINHAVTRRERRSPLIAFFSSFTRKKPAQVMIFVALVLILVGIVYYVAAGPR